MMCIVLRLKILVGSFTALAHLKLEPTGRNKMQIRSTLELIMILIHVLMIMIKLLNIWCNFFEGSKIMIY